MTATKIETESNNENILVQRQNQDWHARALVVVVIQTADMCAFDHFPPCHCQPREAAVLFVVLSLTLLSHYTSQSCPSYL